MSAERQAAMSLSARDVIAGRLDELLARRKELGQIIQDAQAEARQIDKLLSPFGLKPPPLKLVKHARVNRQGPVLVALKLGNHSVTDLMRETGFTRQQVHNALSMLMANKKAKRSGAHEWRATQGG